MDTAYFVGKFYGLRWFPVSISREATEVVEKLASTRDASSQDASDIDGTQPHPLPASWPPCVPMVRPAHRLTHSTHTHTFRISWSYHHFVFPGFCGSMKVYDSFQFSRANEFEPLPCLVSIQVIFCCMACMAFIVCVFFPEVHHLYLSSFIRRTVWMETP